MRIEPCFESKVKAYASSIFTLDYSTEFHVSEVHATLVIESLYLIQRFPVQIEITAGAIELAFEQLNGRVNLKVPMFGVVSN